jgi:hypothetical protein
MLHGLTYVRIITIQHRTVHVRNPELYTMYKVLQVTNYDNNLDVRHPVNTC